MKRNKLYLIFGCAILLVFVIFAAAPGLIAPYGIKEMFTAFEKPCAEHILGTNDLGYDVFTEIVYAARASLIIGVASAAISLVIGTVMGLLAGYLPSWKGEIFSGIIQIFILIPMLPMAIVIAAFAGNTTANIIIIISVLGWCATARTVRTRTLQLKQTAFCESLMILGLSRKRIMTHHILPNLTEVVLSRYIMSVSRCMMLEATLSFLGMGDITEVTWGRMINLAYRGGAFMKGLYGWLIAPGVCIALIILAFYCINRYFELRAGEVSGAQSYLD